MSFAVRRLGPGDESLLAQIAEEAPEFDLAGQSQHDPPLAASDAAVYLTDPGVLHWVAAEDGRVVGEILCHVLRLPFGSGRELLLYAIGVRDGHRRRGVGTALVGRMLGWMRDEGVELVWVLADDPGAEAFDEACGFRRGGEDEQGVVMLPTATDAGEPA